MLDFPIYNHHRTDWLDTFQKIAQIITAGSLVVALGEYFYRRKKDKTIAVIDQISFFRKEIIPKDDELIKFVRDKKGKDYTFRLVRLDEPTIEFTRKNYLEESKAQANLVSELNTIPIQTTLLNMLEELALKIIHFNTADHKALNSIKAPFILLVESNAIVLLIQRNVITGNKTYSSILDLYKLWSNQVERKTPEERLNDILSNT